MRDRRGVQRASVEAKSTALHSDFAREFLGRRFSATVVAALYAAMPTYSRGPRKGLSKGHLHWLRCSEGGWFRGAGDYTSFTGVLTPGARFLRVCMTNEPLSTCVLEHGSCSTDEQYLRWIENAVARATQKRRWG